MIERKRFIRRGGRRTAALLLVLAMLLSTFAWARFEDVSEDRDDFEAIEWACENGIALGSDAGRFEPDEPCSRAAFYTFLWRMAGAPDTDAEDAAWYSDAVAWAAGNGLTDASGDWEAPVTAEEVTRVTGIAPEGPGEAVTRGSVARLLYAAQQLSEGPDADAALDDGSPWVDYVLRENIATVTERPASPKDDMYLYANYDWLKSAEIPDGRTSASVFTDVADQIRDMTMELLTDTSISGRDAGMVRHLYSAYLDWDARDALGVAPVQEVIDRLKAVRTLDELSDLFCDPDSDSDQLFGFGAATGFNDPETYLLLIAPMGLLLGDSAEYAARTEMGERTESAYRTAAKKMLPKLGYTEAEAEAMLDRALALEAELAGSIMTSAESMSPDYIQRINNEMDLAGAGALCKSFPLLRIVDAWGYGAAERCLVTEPAYLKALDQIYREDRLDDLRDYLIFCAALGSMNSLDRDSHEIAVEMSNTMNGSTGSLPDEESAYQVTRSMLTPQLDRTFLAKYDSTKMKEDITRICREAIDFYRTMLSQEDWLTETTRAKAIEKLDAITIHAVYPEKWEDDSALSIDGLGYYDCLRAIGDYQIAVNVSKLGTKVDHDIWNFDILETNAYYDSQDNSINIIRGILGGVFYRDGMSDEELYAGIGSVIGHEISHAFDTNGAQFDKDGVLKDWWTEADYAAFTARADRLAAYYDRMTAFAGYRVQGQNIQTEAIADMAGMKCMLGLIEQKGGDLRAFFDAYAKVWARINTRELEYLCLMQDSHPLHHLRVNATLQQFQQFHEVYDIREGDGMYLAPADRVLVW